MDKLNKLPLNFGSAVLPPPITSKKKQRDSADLTNSFNGLGLDEDSALLGSLQSINIGQKKHISDDKLEEIKKLDEIVRLLRKYDTEGFPETIKGRNGHAGEGELNIFAEWLESMGYENTGHRTRDETKLEFNIKYLAHEVNSNRGVVSLEDLIKDMYPFCETDQDYDKFRQDVITALYYTLTGEQAGDFGGRKKKTKKSKKSKKNKKSCKARKSRRCKKKYKSNIK